MSAESILQPFRSAVSSRDSVRAFSATARAAPEHRITTLDQFFSLIHNRTSFTHTGIRRVDNPAVSSEGRTDSGVADTEQQRRRRFRYRWSIPVRKADDCDDRRMRSVGTRVATPLPGRLDGRRDIESPTEQGQLSLRRGRDYPHAKKRSRSAIQCIEESPVAVDESGCRIRHRDSAASA